MTPAQLAKSSRGAGVMDRRGRAAVWAVAALAAAGGRAAGAADLEADPPMVCSQCEAWNAPQAPFRIDGDTYYVGTAELSSILIASGDGAILLDGALSQSAPLIARNIEALGFRLEDVRLIVNSHAHHDHAGGINALQRASGAEVAASASGARALAAGRPTPDDPQHAFDDNGFPPVAAPVRSVVDGETLRVGALAITAHLTPGHTPGSTTWTWRSCEDGRCVDVVYADSLTAVSAPGFRFADDPPRVEAFRASIAKIAGLPCDVLLTPHPGLFRMAEKLAAQAAHPDANPFVESGACAAYAAGASERLDRRLAEEARGR